MAKDKTIINRSKAQRGNFEFRTVSTEIRANEKDGELGGVAGLGLVYGVESEIFPGYMECIRKDAFKESIERKRNRPIKSYFNHDPNQVLATTSSDPPLVIKNTDDGIAYEAEIPDTSYGRDLAVNLERRNVEGSSFAFSVEEDDDWKDENGVIHREIIKGEIYELGPVTDPAYIQAPANLRSATEVAEEIKAEIELRQKNKEERKQQLKNDYQELQKIIERGTKNA